MFFDPTFNDLPGFIGWDLAAQKDKAWNFRGVG
jgi:hypothetical protein